MKRTARRKKKAHEYNSQTDTTVGDVRNASKSKEQMKKDWGSKKTTMNRHLAK